jgi:hypothetical protein
VKVRFRGLMKNMAQLTKLFVLPNLWMARKQLMGMGCPFKFHEGVFSFAHDPKWCVIPHGNTPIPIRRLLPGAE